MKQSKYDQMQDAIDVVVNDIVDKVINAIDANVIYQARPSITTGSSAQEAYDKVKEACTSGAEFLHMLWKTGFNEVIEEDLFNRMVCQTMWVMCSNRIGTMGLDLSDQTVRTIIGKVGRASGLFKIPDLEHTDTQKTL